MEFPRVTAFGVSLGAAVAAVVLTVCGNASAHPGSGKHLKQSRGAIVVKPSKLSFGSQTAGVTSASTKKITLRSSGPGSRHIDAIDVTGNYSITGNSCVGSQGPQAKCQITLAITPRCPVEQPGSLAIYYDSVKTPLVVSLSGRGEAPSGPSSHQILVTGGLNLNGPLASAELFDPGRCKFSATGKMTMARAFQTATYLDPAVVSGSEAGDVLITGGQINALGEVTAKAELYDPLTATFSPTVQLMTQPRAGHSATLMRGGPLAGKVLLIGGETLQSDGFKATTSAEIYDPSTGTFTATSGSMNVARSQHRALLISGCNCAQDGDVLVTGGYAVDPTGGPNNTAEVFDPSSQTFACVGGNNSTSGCAGVMSSPRWEHAVAMLSNGTVLVSGGEVSNNVHFPGDATQTTDIYNPATGRMVRGPDMHAPRNGQQFAMIPGGALKNQVLVTGGFGDHVHKVATTAEIYDPASNSFQCVGKNTHHAGGCRQSMVDGRATQAAIGLNGGALDGLVLITGGIDFGDKTVLKTAEVFNPSTGAFMKVGSMVSARNEHTVTQLP